VISICGSSLVSSLLISGATSSSSFLTFDGPYIKLAKSIISGGATKITFFDFLTVFFLGFFISSAFPAEALSLTLSLGDSTIPCFLFSGVLLSLILTSFSVIVGHF
jgi:hypothetical protein